MRAPSCSLQVSLSLSDPASRGMSQSRALYPKWRPEPAPWGSRTMILPSNPHKSMETQFWTRAGFWTFGLNSQPCHVTLGKLPCPRGDPGLVTGWCCCLEEPSHVPPRALGTSPNPG